MKRWLVVLLVLPLLGCGGDEETAERCTPSPILEDECGDGSICVPDGADRTRGTCQELQECGPGGTCTVGTTGATCSEGVLDFRTPVCLPGLCKNEADCPTGLVCASLSGVVGVCEQKGAVGSMCETGADCDGSLVCEPPFRSANFKECFAAEPPGEGLCDADFHCGAGAFCAFDSGECRQGTGQFCRSDDDCALDSERCDVAENACVTR